MNCVKELRPAFSRTRTFLWFTLVLMGMAVRTEQAGVTSLVRAHGFREGSYYRFLHLFHSSAVKLHKLRNAWVCLSLRIFRKYLVTFNGRIVLICDGIKIPKEGRKMPGVKRLFQSSDNNSKPEYIDGHSCQAINLLVQSGGGSFAVPWVNEIHEGADLTETAQKMSLIDKLIEMIRKLKLDFPFYLVADAFYANRRAALPLLHSGNHLVSRMRKNSVAYEDFSLYQYKRKEKRLPGRPKSYGKKIKLKDLFAESRLFAVAPSPVPGDRDIQIRYRVVDLYWRPMGPRKVRFVLAEHPVRGRLILLCTDMTLHALSIIRLYNLRFRIELGFKQLIYTLGGFTYHFWMKSMKRRKRFERERTDLTLESSAYRRDIRRKLRAYELHIQCALIAQGLLQYLAIKLPKGVWGCFGSWLRTMNPNQCPSEQVVSQALRTSLPEFLSVMKKYKNLEKFVDEWRPPPKLREFLKVS
ncbi:transposase [Bdellovibrionota bacterium FG-2]